MAVGQGSIQVNQARTPPAAAPTVTAANEGLSLSGTTVQLGAASILSALPLITVNRNIPMSPGTLISLNSSNIATPNNKNSFSPFRIQLLQNSALGSTPSITVDDQTLPNKNTGTWEPSGIFLTKGDATGTQPFFQSSDAILGSVAFLDSRQLTITAGVSQTPQIVITKTGSSESNTATNQQVILVGGAGPKFIVQGLNAAGAVLASQFRNTSTAAAASVSSQWYIDSAVQDFQIIKYSNANVASGNAGGVDLQSLNAGVAAAAIRINCGSTAGTIQNIVNGGIYSRTSFRVFAAGDLSGLGNNINLSISDISQNFFVGKGAQLKLYLDINANTYAMGDISAVTTATQIIVDVNNSRIIMQSASATTELRIGVVASSSGIISLLGATSGAVTIRTQAAAGTYNFNLPTTAGTAGDFLTSGGGGAAPMTFTAITALPFVKSNGATTATANINFDAQAFQMLLWAGASGIFMNPAALTTAIGDTQVNNNGTKLTVNDSQQTVETNCPMYINNVALSGNTVFGVAGLPPFVNDAAAGVGGLVSGECYRTTVAGVTFLCVLP